MIIITGTGRSGTTFLSYLLMNLGFDLGCTEMRMDWVKNPPFFGGGEDDCCSRINDVIHDIIVVEKGGPLRSQFEKGFRWDQLWRAQETVKDRIAAFAHELVKDARFSYCLEAWINLGRRPELVVDCRRDIIAAAKSMLRTKKHPGPLEKAVEAMQAIRDCLDRTISKYNLCAYPIHFPDVIHSPNPLRGLFLYYQPFDKINWGKVVEEHSKLADESLVHH